MSDTDERVVSLRFDNTGFEAGANKAIDILSKLSESLKLDGASAGLDKIKSKIGLFDTKPIQNGVVTAQNAFSKFEAFTFGIFNNLGARVTGFALDMAAKLKGAVTKPVKEGFAEYELNMKSLQTISANSGESFEVINKCLNELNEYADKTVYKFSDMTQNIGRFTAAGLGVEESTKAIQGFSNAAALAGAGPQEAARGMYQLSQAMAAGVVKLQDWKSIQNASIDTEAFKQVIIETARKFGTSVDAAIEKEGSFNASLSEGWLTSEVMQEALENLTKSTRDFADEEDGMAQRMEELVSKGYSEEVAKKIIDIANAADDSAREIRTFSQLMDTMGEAIGTGWADTWKIIIGDFEQATETFTWLGQRFDDIVSRFSDARNNLLTGWSKAGGRDALFGALVNIIEAVDRVLISVGQAFENVFGISGEELAVMTENFAVWTESLVADEETMQTIAEVFQDIFVIADSVFGVIRDIREIILDVFKSAAPLWSTMFESFKTGLHDLAKIANHIRHVFDNIDKFMSGDLYKKKESKYKELDGVLLNLFTIAKKVGDAIKGIFEALSGYWPILVSLIGSAFSVVMSVINTIIDVFPVVVSVFSPITRVFDALSGAVSYLFDSFKWLFNTIKETYSGLIDWPTVIEYVATAFETLCEIISIVINVGSYFIGFIVGVVRTIMVIASPLIKLWGVIYNAALKVITRLMVIGQNVIGIVSNIIIQALDIATRMMKPIRRIFKEIYRIGTYFFKALYKAITNSTVFKTIKDSFTRIKDTVVDVFNAFAPKSLGLKHTIAWYFIHPLKALKDALVEFSSNHKVKFFRTWIEKIGGVISSVFAPAIDIALWMIRGLTDFITGPLADGLKWIAEQIGNYEFKSPIDTFYDAVSWVVDWITNLKIPNPFEAITNWFSSFDLGAWIDNSPFKFIKDWVESSDLSSIISNSPLGKIKEWFSKLDIKNPFSKIKIPGYLVSKLETLKTKFKELSSKTGSATDALKSFAKRAAAKIKTVGSGRIETVISTITGTFDKLVSYFKNLYNTKGSISEAISQIFTDVYNKLREWAGKLSESTNGIASSIGKGFEFVLEQIGKIPNLFSSLFGETEKTVSEGTGKVKKAAEGAKEDAGNFFSNLLSSIPSPSDVVGNIVSFFGQIKDKVTGSASGLFDGVDLGSLLLPASVLDSLNLEDFEFKFPDIISPAQDFVNQFNEFIGSIDTETLDTKSQWVLDFMNRMAKGLAAFEGIKWLNSLTKMNKGLAKGGDGLGKFFENLPKDLGGGLATLGKNITKELFKPVGDGLTNVGKSLETAAKSFSPFKDLGKPSKSQAFLNVAAAILVLAGALFVLSKIPADDLQRAGTAMLQLLGAVGMFVFLASWLSSIAKLDLTGIGIAMAGVGAALVGFAIALWAFTQLSKDPAMIDGMENFKTVVGIMVAAIMLILFAASYGGDLKGVAATILAFAAAVTLMIIPIVALGLLGKYLPDVLGIGIGMIFLLGVIIGGVISVILLVAKKTKSLTRASVAMLALTAAITLMIVPVVLLGLLATYATGVALAGLGMVLALAVIFGAFIVLTSRLSKGQSVLISGSIAMIALAAAITLAIVPVALLAGLIKLLGGNVGWALVAVAVIAAVLTGCAIALGKFAEHAGAMLAAVPAIIAITLCITLLSGVVAALSLLAAVNLAGVWTAIAAIVAVSAAIGILIAVTGNGVGLLAAAGALVLTAIGIAGLGAALSYLTTLDWGAIASGWDQLWNAFANTNLGSTLINVGNLILDFINFVVNTLSWGGSLISGAIGNLFPIDTAKNAGGAFTNNLAQGVSNGTGDVTAAVSNLGDSAGGGLLDSLGGQVGEISGMAENLGGSLLGGFEGVDIPGELGKLAGNGINGLLGGFAQGDLPGQMGENATLALNGFLDGFDMDAISNKGVEMISSLVAGIGDGLKDKVAAKANDAFWGFTHPIEALMGQQPPSIQGKAMGDSVADGISQAIPNVQTKANDLTNGAVGGLSTLPDSVGGISADAWTSLTNNLGGENGYATMFGQGSQAMFGYTEGAQIGLSGLGGVCTDASNQMNTILDQFATTSETKGINATTKLSGGIKNGTGKSKSAVTSVVNSAANAATPFASKMRSKGDAGVSAFASAISAGKGRASGAASSLVNAAAGAAGSLYGKFYSVGQSASYGLAAGINSAAGAAAAAADHLVAIADRAARAKAKVNSPSKLFMVTGRSIGEGLTVGMDQMSKFVYVASSKLIDTAEDGANDALRSMSLNMDDVIDTDYNPVITPVIDPTEFDSGISSMITSFSATPLGNLSIGELNYNEQFSGKLDAVVDTNKQALAAFNKSGIDYGLLGQSVAAALISSGVHVEIDGGKLMGYLAGEIKDARRMYG